MIPVSSYNLHAAGGVASVRQQADADRNRVSTPARVCPACGREDRERIYRGGTYVWGHTCELVVGCPGTGTNWLLCELVFVGSLARFACPDCNRPCRLIAGGIAPHERDSGAAA